MEQENKQVLGRGQPLYADQPDWQDGKASQPTKEQKGAAPSLSGYLPACRPVHTLQASRGSASCSEGTGLRMHKALHFAEPAGRSTYAILLLCCQGNTRTGWLLGNPTLKDSISSPHWPQAVPLRPFSFEEKNNRQPSQRVGGRVRILWRKIYQETG